MTPGKYGLLIIAHVLAVLLAVRLISDSLYLVNRGLVSNVRGRFQSIIENMDRIKKDPPRTQLFVGTSPWHFFLDPVFFDAEMAAHGRDSVSYNLSFFGLVGSPMLTWMNRLRDEFGGEKVQSVFIEFSPVALGTEFNVRRAPELDAVVSAIFANSQVWKNLFRADPQNAAMLMLNQTIRPLNWRHIPGLEYILPVERRRLDADADPMGMLYLWGNRAFNERPLWKLETRGLNNFNRPRAESEFQRVLSFLQTPEQAENAMAAYKRVFHANADFKFDPRAISNFIESVRSAQKFSGRVYLVWLPNSPPFEKLLTEHVPTAELIARIERETDAKIIDLRQAVPVTAADFVDPMHPSPETMKRFLNALASRLTDEVN